MIHDQRNISFHSLEKSHFPLLLKWLEMPHVKAWWDQNVTWTPELIEEKYGTYTHQYKAFELAGRIIKKSLYSYIISCDNSPIGYIQYYDIHDFSNESNDELIEFPARSAALDWYIGEEEYIGKGIGPKALNIFLENYIFNHFEYVFIESDASNLRAIKTYEKIGFKLYKITKNGQSTWMAKEKERSIHE